MGHLPTLRREHRDRMVLDAAQQVTPVLIALARAWREDSEGIGALFADIADRDDQARAEAHLDGLGDAEHARDQLADQLLAEVGGAQFHLGRTRDRHAVHQARRMADILDAHANWIAIEVEEAERLRAAQDAAELQYLRARLGHVDVFPVVVAVAVPVRCRHCSCWPFHANSLPCHLGCGSPGNTKTASR
ncbi:hypothetical protein ABZ672_04135 [Streptomyces mirabilis]|uniref:hypothetical protein n=1 Tax=Streptomyces mirabilis TaxID=68239 RepID=UPI0033C661C8